MKLPVAACYQTKQGQQTTCWPRYSRLIRLFRKVRFSLLVQLKPRPRLTQKRQLLGRGHAAQDGVAVGVAAEALDDGLVAQFKAQGVLHARLRKQAGGLGVHQGGLAVHVGHVGKAALRQGQAAVLPTGHQLLRQRQGQRVLRKGLGCVAVDIARELVEHQDFGQTPLWRGAPWLS